MKSICPWIGCLLIAGALTAVVHAEIDPKTGMFTYSGSGDIDEILGEVGLYLIKKNRREGSAYVSPEIVSGIVGYQLRFFDNGNQVVDQGDWLSVRRYRIPAEPDSTKPEGYYKSDYTEFVDINLNGMDENDYYFLNGRRYDFAGKPNDVLRQYQIQIQSGINAFFKQVSYETIKTFLGPKGQTSIKKDKAFDDGSLPSQMVLGLDLGYIFRPISRSGTKLPENQMVEEIRRSIGFVFSATMEYTDLNGYRFRDLADQTALMQRTYDPAEKPILKLVIDALFDTDGDGVITGENITNGYTRFRELHQQLIDGARSQNRRIVLPGDKLSRLREEYQAVHKRPFQFES